MVPWSDSPNMTLKEYGRQLDKLQCAAKKQGVTISDEDKTTHFVECAKDSGLFKEEWVTEWDATSDISWTLVRNVWVGKWLKITRAATMAAKRGRYKSPTALCGTREAPAPISAPVTVTRAEYDAVFEYVCDLEAENAEQKLCGGDDVTTVSTLEAASAETETTTWLLVEMRAVHPAQMREMTALIAVTMAIIAPAPPRREAKAQA